MCTLTAAVFPVQLLNGNFRCVNDFFSWNLKLLLACSPRSKPPNVTHPSKGVLCALFPWGVNKDFPWRGLGHMHLNWFGSGVFHSSMRGFIWRSECVVDWHHPSPTPSSDDASRWPWRSTLERGHPRDQMNDLTRSSKWDLNSYRCPQ